MFASASTKARRRWEICFHGVLIAAVAVFTIVFLSAFWEKPVPTYNGISINRWIEISRTHGEIREGLAEIGLEAIPWLIRATERKDSPIKNSYLALWQKLPRPIQMMLYVHRPISAKTTRDNALTRLRYFGTEASAAVTPLIKLVRSAKDPWSNTLACNALAEVGRDSPEAQSVLIEELKCGDPVRRSRAVSAIWSAGWKFKEGVPLLMKDLFNENETPLNQLLAIGVISPDATDAAPLLIALLKDQQLRGSTLAALNRIGPGAAAAVPALIEVLQNEQESLHPMAIETLINIGPAAAPALPVLEHELNDESGVNRVLAAFAIGTIRGHLDSAVPTLVRELESEERVSLGFHLTESQDIVVSGLTHRETAVWFLGEIGPSAAEAVPALTRILHSPHGSLRDEWLRILAVRAIWRIGRQAEPDLPTLCEALTSKDEFRCIMAVKILGEMGPPAKSLVPALFQTRKISLAIRREVNDALKKIDPEALIEGFSK